MNRVVFTVGVVVALASPSVALALNVHYNGPAGSGGAAGVEVSAKFVNSRPNYVRSFEWHNVPASCTGSAPTATTSQVAVQAKVKPGGKFRISTRFNGGLARVTVTGKFTHGYQQAAGTLRVRGTISGCRTADTGVLQWRAKH